MKNQITILMADDDLEDQEFVKIAFEEAQLSNPLKFVNDGIELLEYLNNEAAYSDVHDNPKPGLILLDLNMPRMDGRAALQKIRSHPELKAIPVVILTTSKQEEEVFRSYAAGANSYITKPVDFMKLVEVIKALGVYWFSIVEMPRRR